MSDPGAGNVTVADLRPVDLFDDLDDAQLGEFAARATMQRIPAGERVIEQGDRSPGLQCLLEGRARSFVIDGARSEPVGYQEAPTWIGAISVLTDGPVGVRMVAEQDLRMALIPAADFYELALTHPAVHRRVMRQITPIMNRIAGIEQNRERMESLGTMAAGLAHELNNPAAAAKRATEQLLEALDAIDGALAGFVNAGISREQAAGLVALQERAAAAAASGDALTGLDAADAEEELLEVLEDAGIEDAWMLAEPLSTAGVDREWVDAVIAGAGPGAPVVMRWVAASLTAQGLATELQESTSRMSELVGAIKSYAYMDRGEVVETDLKEGLETTLKVMGHKLKHTRIRIERDYDPDLPKVMVRGPELNQVWTNLLDNAIDALGEEGTITLRTSCQRGGVLVEVADDGPGIPEDVQRRIFDPFFTTKAVGSGTGLGLDTARRIVRDRHNGSLTVASGEGDGTAFSVWLPRDAAS